VKPVVVFIAVMLSMALWTFSYSAYLKTEDYRIFSNILMRFCCVDRCAYVPEWSDFATQHSPAIPAWRHLRMIAYTFVIIVVVVVVVVVVITILLQLLLSLLLLLCHLSHSGFPILFIVYYNFTASQRYTVW